jgi:hypothetical protein
MMDASTRSRIDRLSEDTYEHFLREAGDCTDIVEWYAIALAVADRLKELVVQSQQKYALFLPPPGLAEEHFAHYHPAVTHPETDRSR